MNICDNGERTGSDRSRSLKRSIADIEKQTEIRLSQENVEIPVQRYKLHDNTVKSELPEEDHKWHG